MAWKKLGLLYIPINVHPKLRSHAANPLPVHLHGDVYRVYYSGRDTENRSSVGYVELDIGTQEILKECDAPAFSHGAPGSFYEHGVSIGTVYRAANGQQLMLFMGWQCLPDAHWRGDIGALILQDDGTLMLSSESPLMGAQVEDPISLSYPAVWQAAGRYHMLYGSTVTWDAGNGEMLHVLKHAQSQQGVEWERTGHMVPYVLGVAQAFSRPSVLQDDYGFHAWFSYRSGTGEPYRIGYAISEDGINWTLALDETGITVSEQGWDSEMICYPAVFEHCGQRTMLYNGNSYGKTGFGLAVWE